jgi:lysophospholipase L1-like esterase
MMKFVCIGDSLTYGYGAAPGEGWVELLSQQPGLTVLNRGECGDTTAGMRCRFSLDVLEEEPQGVFIMGGANDVLLDVPLVEIEANMAAMISEAAQAGLAVYVGVPPLTKRESCAYGWQRPDAVDRHNEVLRAYGCWLRQYCQDHQHGLVDFAAAMQAAEADGQMGLYVDGIHPGKTGYAIFGACAVRVLKG